MTSSPLAPSLCHHGGKIVQATMEGGGGGGAQCQRSQFEAEEEKCRKIICQQNCQIGRRRHCCSPTLMALIFALLLLLCSFNCLLTVSATAAAGFLTDADMGDDERSNNDIDIEAKGCAAAYECWPTEPVLDDGRPLFMASIVKRLSIGGHHSSRGVKCRCKEGQCTFYSIPKRRFYNCQEL